MDCNSKCYNECFNKYNTKLLYTIIILFILIVIFIVNNLILFFNKITNINTDGLNINGLDIVKNGFELKKYFNI